MASVACKDCYGVGEYYKCMCVKGDVWFYGKDNYCYSGPDCGMTSCPRCVDWDMEESVGC